MYVRRISVTKYLYPYPFKQRNYYPYPWELWIYLSADTYPRISAAGKAYLSGVDSLRGADDTSNASVDDGNCVVLDVGRLLNVLLHLADPSLFQLLQALSKQHQKIFNTWQRRTRYLVLCQYCLVATYELTRTLHNCGQRLPNVHINFNAAS